MPAVQGKDFDEDDFDDGVGASPGDPEQARAQEPAEARRASEEERRRREAQIQQFRADTEQKKRSRRRRMLIAGVGVVVIGAAAVPVWRFSTATVSRAKADRDALNAPSVPAEAIGFKSPKDFIDVPPDGVNLDVPRATCSAVVGIADGSSNRRRIRIEHKSGAAIEADGGIIWCDCEHEDVSVRFVGAPAARTSLRWMRAPMSSVGGAEVMTFQPVDGFTVASDGTGMACADAAFATWASRPGHGDWDPLPKDRAGLAAKIVREGLEPVGLIPASRRYAAVRSERGYCYLVLADGAGLLSLRESDGHRLVSDTAAAIGWCSHAVDELYSLWQSKANGADALVFRAPAARVGGLTGIHEAALRRGIKTFAGHLGEDDLAADATAALLALSIVEGAILKSDAAGLPEKPGMLVAGFSLLESGAYLPDAAPHIPAGCFPPFDPGAEAQAYTCLQARPQRWRTDGKEKRQAAALGPMPFWMSVLGNASDDAAMQAGARLLAFSRRMTLLGFEPTTVEGVRDSAGGAVITGRPGTPDTVAVGITVEKPWIHPLTDGAAWSIDGELRVIKVPEGKTTTMHTAGGMPGNAEGRRVVVWRK